MPLNADQRLRIMAALEQAFPTEAHLEDLVFAVDLPKPTTLSLITTANGIHSQVRDLITIADADGWLPKLVEQAANDRSSNETLTRFRDEIKPLILEANANHYHVLLMGNRPLIDRDPLRQAVERLSTGQKRILVINGEPVSGKSHTIWFIRHLHEQHKNFDLLVTSAASMAGACC